MDYLTIIALAFFAFAVSMGIHEQFGHGLFCLIMGGDLVEISAFNYVCGNKYLPEWIIRISAVAGPIANIFMGGLSWLVLARIKKATSQTKFLLWLFGTINLMTVGANLLFSALTGTGDFGFNRDGLFYYTEPASVWRLITIFVGVVFYYFIFRLAQKQFNQIIGGTGVDRYDRAKVLLIGAYASIIILAAFIGIFSPNGFLIFTSSSAASSLFGTSGILVILRFIDNSTNAFAERLFINQNWWWVMTGFTAALLYALLIAPGVHF